MSRRLNWDRAKTAPRYKPFQRPTVDSWQVGWKLNRNGNYGKHLAGIQTTVFRDKHEPGWRWVRGGHFSKLYRTQEGARIGAEEAVARATLARNADPV